jgi:hypothetical protein
MYAPAENMLSMKSTTQPATVTSLQVINRSNIICLRNELSQQVARVIATRFIHGFGNDKVNHK